MDFRLSPARAVITTVKAIVRRIFSKAKRTRTPRDDRDVPEGRKRIRPFSSVLMPHPAGASTGGMTWGEHQALAKKRAEEEGAGIRVAAAPALSRAPPSVAGRWGAATSVAAMVRIADVSWGPEHEAAPDEEPVVPEFIQGVFDGV
jgi:hypothetical protein